MTVGYKDLGVCFLLLIVSIFVFTRGLSIHGSEYRDDEIFYYQSTKEMIKTQNIWSPTYFGENRFQKPILYYWLILSSYKIFGVNWFGARFVAVIFAALTVCLTWLIARDFFDDRKIANLSAVILMTTPLFFRHAKNAVPDMPLNFFIVLSVYYFIKLSRGSQPFIPFFIACALGFMIKGFAAWIVPFGMIFVYAFITRNPKLLSEMKFGRGFLIMMMIILPWFLFMIKTHGQTYLDYMLVDETKNRLLGGEAGGNIIVEKGKMFFSHMGFYIKNIFSYFAPWSLFIFPAIPSAIMHQKTNEDKQNPLMMLLIWFGVVFFFFSSMYFVINHYMLVLSTPFAILVSYFLLQKVERKGFLNQVIIFFKKYSIVLIFGMGCFVLSFMMVFLAAYSPVWLGVFACSYVFLIWVIHKSSEQIVAPFILGIFILITLSQSTLLSKARITTHSALQRFAETIQQDKTENFVIGVGSHDIHEKEFQVYFNKKVEKAATSEEVETKQRLTKLFKEDKRVYCLMTTKDYNQYLKNLDLKKLQVIQEDYMMRKRMAINGDFFMALLKLDQKTVYTYLMEKIVLVRRDKLCLITVLLFQFIMKRSP